MRPGAQGSGRGVAGRGVHRRAWPYPVAALGLHPHDRGVRPAQRARRPAAPAHRRGDRLVTHGPGSFLDQVRSRAAASRNASSIATGCSPNISVVTLASITNGLVNWYRVVRSSLISGENRPLTHMTGYGICVSLARGAPLTSANLAASWRTVSGGLVGTSQAWP